MLCARNTWIVFGLVLLTLAGCTKRRNATIVRHPEWPYGDYQRIAVLPFQVRVGAEPAEAEAARQAESYLVDLLTGNGAFKVSARSDLGQIMSEQDLSRLAGVADPGTVLPEGMVEIAQAVIVGKITEFELKQEQVQRRVPRVRFSRKGVPRIVGHDVYMEYLHVARVGGNVRVIDVATGRVLLSHTVPAIEKDAARRGGPPTTTSAELAIDLALEIGTDFYRRIAPQQIDVKLDGDCLIVASEYYEGEYEKLKKVPRSLPQILLVACDLPRACDRNDFRLAISAKDQRRYLLEHEFTWSPSKGRRGEVVPLPVSTLIQTGSEEFVAKLFSVGNERPILEREFKLEKPGND